MKTKHLDLGSSVKPRNPYNKDELFAIDVQENIGSIPGVTYIQHDFALKPLPFPDNFFDSISAFDLIEHIPRQIFVDSKAKIIFPFVVLMSEIYRVLKPSRLLLCVTPGYPNPAAFQDPTHVNFITIETAQYFCTPSIYATIYGFKGNFSIKVNRFEVHTNYIDMSIPYWRKTLRRWHRKFFKGGLSHIVWELEALK